MPTECVAFLLGSTVFQVNQAETGRQFNLLF